MTEIIITGLLIFIAFLVSASCGLGGSLILIPGLSWILGIKEGIVVSAVLLGSNNLVKLFFYRKDIRLRPSLRLLVCMVAGAIGGALLMMQADPKLLSLFLLFHILLSFFIQVKSSETSRKTAGSVFSFLSGFCSGLAGTSGPLKGLAVKTYMGNKAEIVATASLLSFATDSTKAIIYLNNFSSDILQVQWLVYSILVMPVATGLGRFLNRNMSVKAYEALFYFVMSGYVLRLLI